MGPTTMHRDAFQAFMACRTTLKAYCLAIVRDPDLAEDVLSEVGIAINDSWERYDRSRPFGPWARGVARRVALKALRDRGRRDVALDDEALESVAATLESMGDENAFERRRAALRSCVERLSGSDRRLVELRYFDGLSCSDVAARVARSLNAVYVALHRIHQALASCIEARLRGAP